MNALSYRLAVLLAALLPVFAAGCGGGSSGPPPDAGSDPSGTWDVGVFGNAITGNCVGTRHHVFTMTFVSTGEGTWDIELIDHTAGGRSGTLQAYQDGIYLLLSGSITTDGGAWSRSYSSGDLLATTNHLSGSMTLTTTAASWCVEYGPVSGGRISSSAVAGRDTELYRGTWRRSADSPALAVILERDEDDRCALFFGDYLLDDRGREHALVSSPAFRLDGDGVFSAHFIQHESDKEYAVLGRLDPEEHVTGEIHVLRAGDGARLWRGELWLERVREAATGW